MPNRSRAPIAEVAEVAGNLKGVTPQSPALTFNRQNWHFVK